MNSITCLFLFAFMNFIYLVWVIFQNNIQALLSFGLDSAETRVGKGTLPLGTVLAAYFDKLRINYSFSFVLNNNTILAECCERI